jgi:putative phage-type endonuclease
MVRPESDVVVRRSGIGGSDIAKIVGQSKWGGPMDVWLEKIGQSAPLIETERMRWGKILEDAVAREYAHKVGRKVRRANQTLRAASAGWRMAHIDRAVIVPAGDPRRGLECKTADHFASSDFGEEGTDQVPPDYALQCHWYLGVTGWDVWDLAVLIGGNQHRIYTIERDDELVELLFTAADDFWHNHVVPRVPPPIDGTEASRRYLESQHVAPLDEIPMSDRMFGLAHRYATLKAEIKEREKAVDETGNAIRECMDGQGLSARDNVKVRWSVVKTSRIDTTALRESAPEIAAKYTKEAEEHRLTVTVKEGGI